MYLTLRYFLFKKALSYTHCCIGKCLSESTLIVSQVSPQLLCRQAFLLISFRPKCLTRSLSSITEDMYVDWLLLLVSSNKPLSVVRTSSILLKVATKNKVATNEASFGKSKVGPRIVVVGGNSYNRISTITAYFRPLEIPRADS